MESVFSVIRPGTAPFSVPTLMDGLRITSSQTWLRSKKTPARSIFRRGLRNAPLIRIMERVKGTNFGDVLILQVKCSIGSVAITSATWISLRIALKWIRINPESRIGQLARSIGPLHGADQGKTSGEASPMWTCPGSDWSTDRLFRNLPSHRKYQRRILPVVLITETERQRLWRA